MLVESKPPSLPAASVKNSWIVRIRRQGHLFRDVASVYGVQCANYLIPLVTVPYLSRVLGPAMWGLVAMAQSFGMYGHLIVEYGFIYSATRDLAQTDDKDIMESIVAGVTGARVLLSFAVLLLATGAYFAVPLFHDYPVLLWSAVISEILKAALPNYYFYGVQRVTFASLLDISARVFSLLGVFFLVRKPEDAWRYFGLQGLGALIALAVTHWMIYSRYAMRAPSLKDAWRMLREGAAMFVFRSAHQIYSLGNAFVLGLFVSPTEVGYYAGAEKISSAAVGMLSPLSTALYPHAASLAKTDLHKAAKLTRASLLFMLACAAALALVMWFGAPLLVSLMLGPKYKPSGGVLQILGLRSPFVAWSFVLGFQWLLALSLERPFQKLTMAGIALNFLLAALLATRFSYLGMAWVVLISHVFTSVGIYFVLRRQRVNPFVLAAKTETHG